MMYQLMIVDDDFIIRRGLSQAIPWEEYGIHIAGVAGDGQAALKMMAKTVPDIVIADIRMPRIDGLEFTKAVRAKYPEVMIILLTAYKDFEYAKTALRLNVYDYLLKPVDNQALLEVVNRAALTKAEQRRITRRLEESLPLLRQQFFLGLIEERYSLEEIRAKMELLEMGELETPLVVTVIKANDYYQRDDRVQKEILKENVLHIIEEMIRPGKGMIIDSGQDEIVLLYAADNLDARQPTSDIFYLAEKIRQSVYQRLGTKVTIGIGNPCDELLKIGRSYGEACAVLGVLPIQEKNQTFSDCDLSVTPQNISVDIYPLTRELFRQLKLGLLEESLGLVERIEVQIRRERLTLDHLQMIGMELAVLLFMEVKDWPEIGEQLVQKYDFRRFKLEIKASRTVAEISSKFRGAIRDICHSVNQARKSMQTRLIDQAMEYIAINFGNGDLSLQNVATRIHLSPTYLSSIFKREKGINFSEFVLELRMNKAMELLRGNDLKVYEVAEMVGYNNEHYFSACFKKYTGISPSDFKNS